MKPTRLSWPAGVILILSATLAALALPASPAAARSPGFGIVQGTVTDSTSSEPLAYANIIFFRMSRGAPDEPAGGTVSGDDGTYTAKLAPGLYRILFTYVSYDEVSVEGVFVAAGDTVRVDGILAPAENSVDKVVVTGEAIRTASGSMLTKLKNESSVSEAITSEQISRSGDGDAAEALERVTGVSVVGRHVFVRGLGERYSSTQVNGAAVGTPEPNKKVVPLDIFPTGVLDNVIIHKTYAPNLDGEFAGGVILLNTKEFSRNAFSQSLSIGRASTATGREFMTYSGGGLDFLGFDDGSRALPGKLEELAGGKRIEKTTFSRSELAAMGRSFANVWSPQTSTAAPNFSYAGLVSRQLRIFGKKSGFLTSLTLSNGYKNLDKEDNTYVGSRTLSPLSLYQVEESHRDILGGWTGNLSVQLADGHKLKTNLLYTRNAEDKSRVSTGLNEDRGSVVQTTQLSYVERGLFSGVLSGNHETGLAGSIVDWSLSYSQGNRNEPDHRTTIYEADDGVFEATGAGSRYPLTRVFGSSTEYTRQAKVDWTLPFQGFESDTRSRVQLGAALRNDDRKSAFRRFGFTDRNAPFGTQIDRTASPEDLLSRENLDQGIYTLEELTRPNDSYVAGKNINAAYGMIEAPVLAKLRAMAGGRYESARQEVAARSPFALADPGTRVTKEDHHFLPAVTLTYSPNKKTNVRMAFSRTLNRPELRELSPFSQYDFTTGYSETGDTSLVTARIRNLDSRLEYYPGPGEMVAFGVFHKDFDRPIQKFVSGTTGGYALRPQNGQDARLSGYEAELRLSFMSLWDLMDWMVDLGEKPTLMARMSLVANYGQVDSKVKLTDSSGNQVEKPLAGQSSYSTNLGVFYGHRKWEAGLLYKTFGRRLFAFGLSAKLPDIYEYPTESLDFSVGYQVSPGVKMRLSADNLLDQALEFRQADKVTQRYKNGTTVGISFRYEPGASE